jgi:hypothetical protein
MPLSTHRLHQFLDRAQALPTETISEGDIAHAQSTYEALTGKILARETVAALLVEPTDLADGKVINADPPQTEQHLASTLPVIARRWFARPTSELERSREVLKNEQLKQQWRRVAKIAFSISAMSAVSIVAVGLTAKFLIALGTYSAHTLVPTWVAVTMDGAAQLCSYSIFAGLASLGMGAYWDNQKIRYSPARVTRQQLSTWSVAPHALAWLHQISRSGLPLLHGDIKALDKLTEQDGVNEAHALDIEQLTTHLNAWPASSNFNSLSGTSPGKE